LLSRFDTGHVCESAARLDDRIKARLEAFAEIMGTEVGLVEKRFNTELKRLEDKIAALEAEVEILRAAKNVMPFRGARDVA
jgi:hypothetical protein